MNKLIATLLFFTAGPAFGAPLPQYDNYVHTGVPTCATSTCHGKINAQPDENVQLNEYHMWSTDDFHSRAFQVLRNEESKAMAEALGLANAQNSDICLDCHADNIPTELRGPKFQLSDGVGCEGCHGGAQNWLKSHTDPGATHEANLKNGLFPLSDPLARADLCLSCHMGTKDKFTTHAIMAAGHPRLSFELDTFTANQPAHYQLDADYIERKGNHPLGYLWLAGQVESAKRQLALVDAHHLGKTMSEGRMEFSIYDCHSCHQGMKPRRGRPQDYSSELPSGGLRLMDHSFDMVGAIVQVLNPDQYPVYEQAVRKLHMSHNKPQDIGGAIETLSVQLQALGEQFAGKAPSPQAIAKIREQIAANAARGRYADYGSAEQAFLALEALSFALNDRAKFKTTLDQIYASLGDETAYQPQNFAKASNGFLNALR